MTELFINIHTFRPKSLVAGPWFASIFEANTTIEEITKMDINVPNVCLFGRLQANY